MESNPKFYAPQTRVKIADQRALAIVVA